MTTVLQTLVVEAYLTEPSFAAGFAISCLSAWDQAAPQIDRKLA
jgi:hypothetical protein